jgi:hypothetical protein
MPMKASPFQRWGSGAVVEGVSGTEKLRYADRREVR